MTHILPESMSAVRIEHHQLRYICKPLPQPAAHEVLIRVYAAGVNRADLFQVQGSYPFPTETDGVLGLEFAGKIVACGEKVTRWNIGNRVCGIVAAGGYAEYTTAHADHLLSIPDTMSYAHAACFPEAMATVWLSLFMHAHIQPHEGALVHGGSSGIGVMAIQMLTRYGIEVFATAGSPEKCDTCTRLGATAINYRTEDFVQRIKNATSQRGVDVILDMVGGEYVERNIRSLAAHGRIISIAFLHGATIQANMAGLLMKDAQWRGTRLRAQSDDTKAQIFAQLQQWAWPDVCAGRSQPVLYKVFSLQDAEKAHATMQEGLHIGKIILKD
jgi:NADPH2:quinone reductase